MTEIRKARHDDAPALWQLRVDAINGGCRDHYSDEAMDRWTEGPLDEQFTKVVAEHFYLLQQQERHLACGAIINGQIEGLFVHPDAMGRGLGQAMLIHLEAVARQQGLTRLTLEATLNAAPFYRHMGYQGDRIARYHSPRGFELDCVPMEKLLVSAP